jgi:hypothetical protein
MAWSGFVQRVARAWHAYRVERTARRLDAYYRRARNDHERYLSRAHDHYELERLERDWSRRHADVWRVL